MAESVLDEIEEHEDDNGNQYCTDVLTFIDRQNGGSLQPYKEKPLEKSTSKKEREEINLPHNPLHRTTHSPFTGRPEPNCTFPEVTLRREFKIMGQIGECGQKEK